MSTLRTDTLQTPDSSFTVNVNQLVSQANLSNYVTQAQLNNALASQNLNVKLYGAVGDGVANDTPAINAALADAILKRKAIYFPTGVYKLSEAFGGAGYCLLNRGVSMIGEGALRVQLVPDPALPPTADYIWIKPTASDVLDFVEISGLFVYPNAPGNKRGKRALFVDMSAVSNASSFHIDGCYFAPGNDYSFEWFTDSVNIQGGPANSLFERTSFWEGVKLTNHGDSNTFRNCIMRSSVGSGRVGVNSKSIFAGGGQASQLTIEQCNMDCDGGAIIALNGLKYTIIKNNIEQSHGTGTGSGACVDLDGTQGGCAWAQFEGNSVGAFGTAALSSILRINNAYQTKVSHNRFSSATAGNSPTCIFITGSATDTIVEQNEIGTNFTTTINDLGVGTRGVPRTINPINGFSNVGSGYQPLVVYKSPSDGSIRFNGFINCPASPNGVVIGNSPAGFRPTFTHRMGVQCTVSSANSEQVVEIGPTGDMVYFGLAATQLAFDGQTIAGVGFVNGNL